MPASEVDRTIACVPKWRGTSEWSEIASSRRARPSGARLMPATFPTGTPPTLTWSPWTSWLAFETSIDTWYEAPPSMRTRTRSAAATTAPVAASLRGRTHAPFGAACRRELAEEPRQNRYQAPYDGSLGSVHPCHVQPPRHPQLRPQPVRQERGGHEIDVFRHRSRKNGWNRQIRPQRCLGHVARRVRDAQGP